MSGGKFSARACRNCNELVTDPAHNGSDCHRNRTNSEITPGTCWRCGSVDVRAIPRGCLACNDGVSYLSCAACRLVMSEAKQ